MCLALEGTGHERQIFSSNKKQTVSLPFVGVDCLGDEPPVLEQVMLPWCHFEASQRKGVPLIWLWFKKMVPKWVTLASGNLDQNLRNVSCFILSHTHLPLRLAPCEFLRAEACGDGGPSCKDSPGPLGLHNFFGRVGSKKKNTILFFFFFFFFCVCVCVCVVFLFSFFFLGGAGIGVAWVGG